MVSELQSQINNSFNDLIQLLSAESKVNEQASEFLKYVKEKQSLQGQSVNQIKETLRGINRYSDEFEFSDMYAKKIKNNIDLLYDLTNQLTE